MYNGTIIDMLEDEPHSFLVNNGDGLVIDIFVIVASI